MKKIMCILMSCMIVTLTGCGGKDDTPPVTPNQSNQVETPGVVAPEPEPEPSISYANYFPEIDSLGLSLTEFNETTTAVEDEFEGSIRRYVLDGIDVCDVHYDDVFVYVDDNDMIRKVEYNFFFGNLYGDIVDLQIQDSSTNLNSVYELLSSINAVDISGDEGNLLDIVEDYNSGKLLEGGSYSSSFAIDEFIVDVNCDVITNKVGLIIMQSISFKLDSVDNNSDSDVTETTSNEVTVEE